MWLQKLPSEHGRYPTGIDTGSGNDRLPGRLLAGYECGARRHWSSHRRRRRCRVAGASWWVGDRAERPDVATASNESLPHSTVDAAAAPTAGLPDRHRRALATYVAAAGPQAPMCCIRATASRSPGSLWAATWWRILDFDLARPVSSMKCSPGCPAGQHLAVWRRARSRLGPPTASSTGRSAVRVSSRRQVVIECRRSHIDRRVDSRSEGLAVNIAVPVTTVFTHRSTVSVSVAAGLAGCLT